jgi:hypothetical protein
LITIPVDATGRRPSIDLESLSVSESVPNGSVKELKSFDVEVSTDDVSELSLVPTADLRPSPSTPPKAACTDSDDAAFDSDFRDFCVNGFPEWSTETALPRPWTERGPLLTGMTTFSAFSSSSSETVGD